jgi:hypothetical protein
VFTPPTAGGDSVMIAESSFSPKFVAAEKIVKRQSLRSVRARRILSPHGKKEDPRFWHCNCDWSGQVWNKLKQ